MSPDGRFLAYNSAESGSEEVFVRPFPDTEAGRWQVSVGGGTRPQWGPDGKELFYLVPPGVDHAATTIMAVPVQLNGTFTAGKPTVAIKGAYAIPNRAAPVYDISRDGKRFLVIKESEQKRQLLYIQSWAAALAAR